jgi:hypothetical protein
MTAVLSLQQQKLVTLCKIEGFETVDQLMEAAALDSVSPAICMTEGCDYTCEMEPDQDRGWCEECQKPSMKSALVIMGVI